jgi:hypothetical protein
MCFDAEHFTSYTENFKIFAHQSGKFRVENTVTKSAKMHQIAYSFFIFIPGVISPDPCRLRAQYLELDMEFF